MIENQDSKRIFTVGTSAVFPFNVRFFKPDNLRCYLENGQGNSELLTLDVDYSVEVKASYLSGATVRLLRYPLPSGKKLVIQRILPLTQDISLPNGGKLPSESLEYQLDKVVMMLQQLQEAINRAVIGDPISGNQYDWDAFYLQLQEAVNRANQAADKANNLAAGIAKNEFEVFYSLSGTPPEGAYLLDGQTVNCADAKFDKFWAKLQELMTAGKIRTVTSTVFEQELTTYGQCAAFVVGNRSIRLPKITRFIRAAGSADGGTAGLDAIVNLTGSAQTVAKTWYGDTDSSGVLTDTVVSSVSKGLKETDESHTVYTHTVELDASKQVNVGDEVTPKYVCLYLYMQVYTPESQAGSGGGDCTLYSVGYSSAALQSLGGYYCYTVDFTSLGYSSVGNFQLFRNNVLLTGSHYMVFTNNVLQIKHFNFDSTESATYRLTFTGTKTSGGGSTGDDAILGDDCEDNTTYWPDSSVFLAYDNLKDPNDNATQVDDSRIPYPLKIYSSTFVIVDKSNGSLVGNLDYPVCSKDGPTSGKFCVTMHCWRDKATGRIFVANICDEHWATYKTRTDIEILDKEVL